MFSNCIDVLKITLKKVKLIDYKDLIELLERNGWKFKRHGANHDIYVKGKERESEDLAKLIFFKTNP